jgi:hypothetical protein
VGVNLHISRQGGFHPERVTVSCVVASNFIIEPLSFIRKWCNSDNQWWLLPKHTDKLFPATVAKQGTWYTRQHVVTARWCHLPHHTTSHYILWQRYGNSFISQFSDIPWLPQSPDLTTLDFSFAVKRTFTRDNPPPPSWLEFSMSVKPRLMIQ